MSISASFQIDTAAFRAVLEARRDAAIEANKRAAERIKDLLVEKIQPNCRVKTGNERDGWARDSYVESGEDGIDKAVAANTVEYAVYQNYGTKYISPTWELQIGMSEAAAEAREIWAEELRAALNGDV
jgi:hypothetical protein